MPVMLHGYGVTTTGGCNTVLDQQCTGGAERPHRRNGNGDLHRYQRLLYPDVLG